MTNHRQQDFERDVRRRVSTLEEDDDDGDGDAFSSPDSSSHSSNRSSNHRDRGEQEEEEERSREYGNGDDGGEEVEDDESDTDTSTTDDHVLFDVPSTMALPREHSYLEESHPLLPDADRRNVEGSSYPTSSSWSWSSSGQHATETNPPKTSEERLPHHRRERQHGAKPRAGESGTVRGGGGRARPATTHELAVLELHGVVLFPGSTIPVKLRNRSMIRYLGKRIQRCRTDPAAQPRVLIGILPYESPPPTTVRAATADRGVFGGDGDDNDREDDRHHHHLPRRRRQPGGGFGTRGNRRSDPSWLRQRFSFGNGDIAPTASSFRLRQSLTALRDEFRDWSDDDHDDDTGGAGDEEDNEPRPPSPPPPPPPKPSHPLVGRIGTIATVQHTHERIAAAGGASSSSSPWGRYEEVPELVFTAVGTSRFRIVSCQNDRRDIFVVEELPEAIPKRPPVSPGLLPFRGGGAPPRPVVASDVDESAPPAARPLPTPNERVSWNLSQVTPHPYFLYDRRSPWGLVEKINRALENHDGRRRNLPSLGDGSTAANRSKLEPRTFSYWMANNAPFSEGERLKLLKMDSVLERLLYIWKSVETLTAPETLSRICCGLCGIPLASTAQIFVVGGAEGTTSAYVNGHGFIHQITTLRKVIHEPTHLSFRDLPSTENTYFPGYSWWITCCNRCGSMLGWKFQKVAAVDPEGNTDENDDESAEGTEDGRTHRTPVDPDTPERPPYFYGFMASNVKIVSRSNPGGASD